MKANLENESTFWKWKHIPRMKAHFENESTFWKWKHSLKMKAQFENESTFWKWKQILKMKAQFQNKSTFCNWKHISKVSKQKWLLKWPYNSYKMTLAAGAAVCWKYLLLLCCYCVYYADIQQAQWLKQLKSSLSMGLHFLRTLCTPTFWLMLLLVGVWMTV